VVHITKKENKSTNQANKKLSLRESVLKEGKEGKIELWKRLCKQNNRIKIKSQCYQMCLDEELFLIPERIL